MFDTQINHMMLLPRSWMVEQVVLDQLASHLR